MNLFIKPGYRARGTAVYFDDTAYADDDIIHQPHAYTLAGFLASRYHAETIIDIGCGSGRKLMGLQGIRRIGIDYGANLVHCKQLNPDETWVEADLESCRTLDIPPEVISRSVVLCADVIEHLVNPTNLLALLSKLATRARAVIITTPDRDLVRGIDDAGPPANAAHVREWNIEEFHSLLRASDLAPTFIGLTINNNKKLEKKTILAVIDGCPLEQAHQVPNNFRPIALCATYNDADIAPQTVNALLDDQIDVWVLDNWSGDGTFEALESIASVRSSLNVERFPANGPSPHYEWSSILTKKQQLAATFPNRWVIHHDSDEVRASPWANVSLRAGLYLAQRMNFNAVDFTVCDFRPVESGFSPGVDPRVALRFFEFGRRPGHFKQVKAWLQGAEIVNLTESGGHDVQFNGRRIFPYKFLLKHYPLRSPDQARRKVFQERLDRFSPEERASGLHTHYDRWNRDDPFLWSDAELIHFDEHETRASYLVELISGIGIDLLSVSTCAA
jgi:hypothetical protein